MLARQGDKNMKKVYLFLFLFMIVGVNAWALDVNAFNAKSIDVTKGEVTLYSHESILLGLSCKSGPVSKLTGLRTISIGDTIKYGKYAFRVGIIKVSKFNEDAKLDGKTMAKKGDMVCVVAANENALPSEKDCNALWLRIVNCQPLQ